MNAHSQQRRALGLWPKPVLLPVKPSAIYICVFAGMRLFAYCFNFLCLIFFMVVRLLHLDQALWINWWEKTATIWWIPYPWFMVFKSLMIYSYYFSYQSLFKSSSSSFFRSLVQRYYLYYSVFFPTQIIVF